MSTVADYKIITKVYDSVSSLVYRALPHGNERYVILKILKKDYPNPSELTRYKQEYEITRSLKIQGTVLAYDLLPYENTLAIVLEDFGGQSLDNLIKSRFFTILEFLQIAMQIAEALAGIHGSNIIHKDINPSNIILNPETGQVKIIDFGISSIFTKETPGLKNPQVLEGTLAYMSPEQTGRMNRSLDYRTDFYSLGATFYKILTKQMVFASQDALELVHCHIAREPIPPDEINPSIPKPISRIVMKLLAKTAEDRYQTGLGLKADLEECFRQLQQTGEITAFPLARHDFPEQLQIPQKLYGRESEIKQLLEIFKRVTEKQKTPCATPETPSQKRAEMMLVGGFSGIGKTALIQELYRPISQQSGYFISGKFDQFQRNIPYSAIVSALQSLARQLLTENQAQLNQWKTKLNEVLGVNGQVIVDVIPEIEQIIGKQPSVQPLEPAQAQNRFNRVFQNFIRVFCQKSHPLVIFLDDLQWADFGTLNLIELMMSDRNMQYLLLLGAYRDNEVDANHPTILVLERLKEQGAIVNQIILTPLDIEDIRQLLMDTLHRDREAVHTLAELILQKTSGNPFFINEFLKTIERESLFTFNHDRQVWEWQLSQIIALDITDNVVDLMIDKLRKMQDTTQTVLRLAACIGNSFDLDMLSIIYKQSKPETFQELLPAIQQGLIQPLSDLEVTSEALLESTLIVRDYKFRHDRIQQAAYSLTDSELVKSVHLQIGRSLLANFSKGKIEENLFTLLDHFNKGIDLIEEKSEKNKLLEMNLYAGKKAKEAIAYVAAKNYLLLVKDEFLGEIWEQKYDMALELYKELAEIEFLIGNIEESQDLIKIALKHAKSILDCTEFYYLQIVQDTMLGRFGDALRIGGEVLEKLGNSLPKNNFRKAFDQTVKEYKTNLGNRDIDSLYSLPEMKLPEKKAALKILARLFSAAFLSDSFLAAIIGLEAVNLNLKYGHTRDSSMAYNFASVVSSHFLDDYYLGDGYGQLAIRLSNKYQNLSAKSLAYLSYSNFIVPWLKPIKLSRDLNLEGIGAGLQSGDPQMVGYIMNYGLYNVIYQGENLEYLLEEVNRGLSFARDNKEQWSRHCFLAGKICIQNLLGLTQDMLVFDTENFQENDFLESCQSNQVNAAICLYYIFKIQILYLYGCPSEPNSLSQAQELITFIPGTISIAKLNFYSSLNLISRYATATLQEKEEYWQQLQKNQQEMESWAKRCPENFLHKYLLVAAEMARISDRWQEAMELYDRAIESAKEHEFIQNEALGNELAAKFWLARGKEDFAKLYMRKAHQGYQIWGAKRKVELLEEKYPQWFVSQPSHSQSTVDMTTGRATETLDIATVIKASQTLSGEIVLKKLLGKLMEIAIANAGAEKGFLLLKKNDNWFIEAEGSIGNRDVKALQSIPIESESREASPLLPLAIVNFVTRAKENVILNDAVQEGEYNRDPYIIANQPKSILCTPLIEQGQLSGVLYLENNLTTNAFTSDRVELLRIISSQAAISIENARLYDTLERRVEERTAELSQTVQVLEKTQAELKLENELLKSDEQADSFDYQIGGSLNVNAPTYVVRSADRHLYQAMRQGEFCYTFNARQMGKSSLMVRIMNELRKEGYRCISLDLTGVGGENCTPDQWYKGIAVEMWRKFKLLRKFKLKPWWSELTDIPAPQRLKQFIEEVILTEVKKEDSDELANIVIFLDEIDCVLSLPFPVNDFFALIRACYNQRAIDPVYDRLTFALFGAATPSTLIADPQKTPFNIGRPIHLEGFKVNEAQPLLYGLSVNNPQTILKAIIDWTGGQPFLTQKVCSLIRNAKSAIPPNGEEQWIADLVEENILKNWEAKDDPEHLKTVRDRVLKSDRRQELLEIYQQIVLEGEAPATYSETEKELLLSGLAIACEGKLKVNNRIYQSIFNRQWLESQLTIKN
ncbi:MAG: AAA family ATPase [Cyanobacteria bacterium SBLK]|nr:AAA family ATPase [Cyanobacteria bacterium SBLK]